MDFSSPLKMSFPIVVPCMAVISRSPSLTDKSAFTHSFVTACFFSQLCHQISCYLSESVCDCFFWQADKSLFCIRSQLLTYLQHSSLQKCTFWKTLRQLSDFFCHNKACFQCCIIFSVTFVNIFCSIFCCFSWWLRLAYLAPVWCQSATMNCIHLVLPLPHYKEDILAHLR